MSHVCHFFRLVLITVMLLGIGVPLLAQTQSGQLRGSVVDDNGDPVAGALITAEKPPAPGQETTADDNGRFVMIGFATGAWNVSVTAEGYIGSSSVVEVRQTDNLPVTFTLGIVRHALVQALGEEAMEGLDPDEIEQELEAADAAFNEQNWDTAIAGYAALMEKIPALTSLYTQLGQAYRSQGNFEAALASFEALLAADEGADADRVRADIARTRLAMGDFEAAGADLAQAASGLDASREDLYNLGELEFAKGDVDTAAQWYEKATMVDPNWVKPVFKLALVSLNKGDLDTAKQHFQKVVDLEPNSEEGAQASATLAALP